MEINESKLSPHGLTATERMNFDLIYELVCQLELDPKFRRTIGAHLVTTDTGTKLHISSFSSSHLSEFMIRLMSALAEAKLKISFSKENIENLWSPTWTSVITLDRG